MRRTFLPCRIRNLAEGGYLSRSEPIIFLGEIGTGKTYLATGLAVAACRQKKRVRFTTAAEMVNELIEAKNQSELNRGARRWWSNRILAGPVADDGIVADGCQSKADKSWSH
jgi:KaiC/GvpD/RAD55 family RecA-like ATPase